MRDSSVSNNNDLIPTLAQGLIRGLHLGSRGKVLLFLFVLHVWLPLEVELGKLYSSLIIILHLAVVGSVILRGLIGIVPITRSLMEVAISEEGVSGIQATEDRVFVLLTTCHDVKEASFEVLVTDNDFRGRRVVVLGWDEIEG